MEKGDGSRESGNENERINKLRHDAGERKDILEARGSPHREGEVAQRRDEALVGGNLSRESGVRDGTIANTGKGGQG